MPIVLEEISNPSPQDLIDLQKIYADAPETMVEEGMSEAFVQALLQASNGKLIAARFNSRLLAALVLTQGDGGSDVKNLCVREITRKRGIASTMLELLKKEYPALELSCKR